MNTLFIHVELNMPPLDIGYTIEMKEKSVKKFEFPDGDYWAMQK